MPNTPVPAYLYKIVSKEEWRASARTKCLPLSPVDTDFIHLATEEQVAHVVKKFWSGREYLILKVDPQKITGELKYETNPGGTTKYYHLYNGCIPLEAVVTDDTNRD